MVIKLQNGTRVRTDAVLATELTGTNNTLGIIYINGGKLIVNKSDLDAVNQALDSEMPEQAKQRKAAK